MVSLRLHWYIGKGRMVLHHCLLTFITKKTAFTGLIAILSIVHFSTDLVSEDILRKWKIILRRTSCAYKPSFIRLGQRLGFPFCIWILSWRRNVRSGLQWKQQLLYILQRALRAGREPEKYSWSRTQSIPESVVVNLLFSRKMFKQARCDREKAVNKAEHNNRFLFLSIKSQK